MSMKLKKTLALVLSLATVFSAAFTSMADVEVVEELDQIMVPEEPVEEVSDIFNTATVVDAEMSAETAEEITEVVSENKPEESSIVPEDLLGGKADNTYYFRSNKLSATVSEIFGYVSINPDNITKIWLADGNTPENVTISGGNWNEFQISSTLSIPKPIDDLSEAIHFYLLRDGSSTEESYSITFGYMVTAADIIATVDFPRTEQEQKETAPANAWWKCESDGCRLYMYAYGSEDNVLCHKTPLGFGEETLSLGNTKVTKSGDTYVWESNDPKGGRITFHMADGKLCAISMGTKGDFFGTHMGTYSPTGSFFIVNDKPESDKNTNHGYLAIDTLTAKRDTPVTITVVPEKGYQLKKNTLKVTSKIQGAPITKVTPDPDDSKKYTFTMPFYYVTVTAEFEKLPQITTWAQLKASIKAAGTTPTTITLTQDLTAESTDEAISIGANQNITLDLNGFTLDRGLSGKEAAGNGEVIYIENGGKLTLTDSSDAKTGTVKGGNNKSGTPPTNGYGGGVHNAGTFIMEDGTISGNAAYLGGGVFSSGEFTMQGGNISENVSNGNGGGIYIQSRKSFVMTDGKICGNTSNRGGGGIFLEAETSFFMKGGEITGNKAENGNKLGFPGGGVLFQSDSGEMHVGGTAVIKNNKGSKDGTESESNVSTYGSALLIGTGSDVPRPAEGMLISIELVEKIENAVAGDEKYFTADDPEYEVVYNSAGYLELKKFTIADILPSDFPTSVENAWVHETAKDKIAYKNSSEYLYVGGDMVLLATNVTASGDDYVCTYKKYGKDGIITNKLTFHMVDGELQSITLESPSVTESAGTYTRPTAPTSKVLSSVAVTGAPTRTSYTEGETFDPAGIVITATYGDGTTAPVTGYTFAPSGALKASDTTVTISYTEGGVTKSATVAITVARKPDPKPVPTHDDDDHEPLFTGTWNNPVKSGAWSQDSHGIWHYTSSEIFRNTWAYIYNPYAHDGQHTSDWFWFDRQGNMLTGWQFINGKWYYLNPTKDGTLGACQLGGVTPDGWTVDESGAWIESIPRK